MPHRARPARRMIHTQAALVGVGIALLVLPLAGCTSAGSGSVAAPDGAAADDIYHVDESLGEWIDPETGYDTTRQWDLDGGEWPVCIVMSPSQSPQLLLGDERGI